MTTAEHHYIHSLLEPTDILTGGNYKRHKPVVVEVHKPPSPSISEAEDNRRQDEYLLWAQGKINHNLK